MIKAFLEQEKWMIFFFTLASILGYISSVILIGGPVTYSGPIGAWTGFLIFEVWNWRSFKKEWGYKEKSRRYG